jgi:DNA-directed RNA polymerase II subunit RPB2
MLDSLKPYDIAYSVKVFVNGDWYGQTFDPHFVTTRMRAMRRNGAINIYTSIAWHIFKKEIHIWSDSGRLCRPLYVVGNNKINISDAYVKEMIDQGYTWKDILAHPIKSNMTKNKNPVSCADYDDSDTLIEYLDVEEIDTCMVAMTIHNLELNNRKNDSFYNYTHCEIHPSMMFGVLTANIPYAEHNPAPRNMFQAAQCKQAMGIYTTSFKKRMDTLAYILHYPQKSLVNTMNSKYLHSEDIPAGQTAIVAIATYMGYNQEDSLIFNQSSVERGLYNSSLYKTYIDEEKKNLTTLEEEKFCKPEKYYANGNTKTEKMSFGSYEKLDADGFVKVGSKVDGNDIIIGKVVPIKGAMEGDPKFRDASTALAETDSGIVDMVYKNRNGDGYMFAKVRIKSDRDPELGDKFSSRHGQKGTIGMTLRQEDMPYTKDGVVPDVIMTPHALPKRMTIGQFIECIFGKAGIIAGSEFDSTPFRKVEIEKIAGIMESLGFSGAGTEVMYNGKTGKQMDSKIFIGPVFYHRLKHLSREKIHGRATGPYQLLVRQPAEGRSRGKPLPLTGRSGCASIRFIRKDSYKLSV